VISNETPTTFFLSDPPTPPNDWLARADAWRLARDAAVRLNTKAARQRTAERAAWGPPLDALGKSVRGQKGPPEER
jgi:hypothetical protein